MIDRCTRRVFAFVLIAGLWLWALASGPNPMASSRETGTASAAPSTHERWNAVALERKDALPLTRTHEPRFGLELDDGLAAGVFEVSPVFAAPRPAVRPSTVARVPGWATHDPSQPRGPPAVRA